MAGQPNGSVNGRSTVAGPVECAGALIKNGCIGREYDVSHDDARRFLRAYRPERRLLSLQFFEDAAQKAINTRRIIANHDFIYPRRLTWLL